MDGLASARARARARGRVGGRRPKLTADQAALAQELYDTRDKTVQQIADLFGVPRSTVYGHLKGRPPEPSGPGGRTSATGVRPGTAGRRRPSRRVLPPRGRGPRRRRVR
ncbi:helix-turn-helix domain-containing protein [Microbispora sp. NPDC046933]|uniref:helix-turn-helix domain-containing protein n=1 Tax=Microbispora sp. NPDC046933 TaxID=3155618 RepID=UPI0033DA99CA